MNFLDILVASRIYWETHWSWSHAVYLCPIEVNQLNVLQNSDNLPPYLAKHVLGDDRKLFSDQSAHTRKKVTMIGGNRGP